MAGKNNKGKPPFHQLKPATPPKPKQLAPGELLASMKDDKEYESLLSAQGVTLDVASELKLAVKDVENLRKRPLLIYAANVVSRVVKGDISIGNSDDLPFCEMVDNAPTPQDKSVDLFVVTPGGAGQQIAQFVHNTRKRFDRVGFIVPHMAMSAGTLWALAAEEILMSHRAYLGPIDPQVPGPNGRLLPAQALQVLLKDLQERGQKAIAAGRPPDWTDQAMLHRIDPKELGDSITQSQYSILMAKEHIIKYKFREWLTHSSDGRPVTTEDREARASQIARELCAHDKWKTHGHGISRDVLEKDLRIKITRTESIDGLDRAVRRLWALLCWTFEHTNILKIFLSQNYALMRAESTI